MQPLRFVVAFFSLCLVACTDSAGEAGKSPVATIDGEAITTQSLKEALAFAEKEDGKVGGDLAAIRRILDQKIEKHLLLRAAATHGIKPADQDIENALSRKRQGWEQGDFEETLSAEGITADELRARLAERLAIERLFADQVMARVAVTDDEIAEWLEAHREELVRPEQVRASQIVVKTESEAQEILARLKKGESFEELAGAHSLSPDGKNGGDLGFFARGEMPPPFDEVCFSLYPGQLSDVVSSSYGFHVFRLLERRNAQAPSIERQRLEAERRLRREKEAAAWQAYLTRLHEAARIDIDEAALERLMGSQ